MMRLHYFTANAAWAFTFGDQLLRMEGEEMFFATKDEAKEAALRHGLRVASSGLIHSQEGDVLSH